MTSKLMNRNGANLIARKKSGYFKLLNQQSKQPLKEYGLQLVVS